MNTPMKREDYWRLTVAHWESAVEAGLRPVIAHGFPDGDQYYHPHDFDFQSPPSREDFLQVCRQLPWTSVWDDSLLPMIEKNDWPMIDFCVKASYVDLKDDQGRTVGRLEVRRHNQYQNQSYGGCFFSIDERDKALRGLKGDKLKAGFEALNTTYENRVRERIIKEEAYTEVERIRIMQTVLHELGIRKSKPKTQVTSV